MAALETRPTIVAGEEGSVATRTPSPWSGTEFPGIEYFVCQEPVKLVEEWGRDHGIEVGIVGDEFTAILDAAPTKVAITMDISLHWRDDDARLTYLVMFYGAEPLAKSEQRRVRRKLHLPKLLRKVNKATHACAEKLDASVYRATMPRAPVQ